MLSASAMPQTVLKWSSLFFLLSDWSFSFIKCSFDNGTAFYAFFHMIVLLLIIAVGYFTEWLTCLKWHVLHKGQLHTWFTVRQQTVLTLQSRFVRVAWHDNCRKWCSDAAHDARRITYNCSVVVDKAVQHRLVARRSKLIPAEVTATGDFACLVYVLLEATARPWVVRLPLLTVRRRWTI